MQAQRIVDLPLLTRDVTQLMTLTGAAVSFPNGRYPYMISIAGQPSSGEPFGTDYFLDGANHINYQTSATMPSHFRMPCRSSKSNPAVNWRRTGVGCDHGRDAVGLQQFHGNLFEFLRNSAFGAAREYFSPTAVNYKESQYGEHLAAHQEKQVILLLRFPGYGHPFESRQHNHQRSDRGGAGRRLDTYASAACNGGVAKTLKAPFVNNTISPSTYSAPAVFIANKLLQSLAASGVTPNQCGLITYNVPAYSNVLQFTARFDYQLSDKQSIFFRGLDTHTSAPNAFSLTPNILDASDTGLDVLVDRTPSDIRIL